MRLMVTGGRDFGDRKRVDEALDQIHEATPLDVLIHGDAPGVDTLAADWARRRNVPIDPYPADWDNIDCVPCKIKTRRGKPYNALAGFNRNLRMIKLGVPHMVAVFPGGPGTAHARSQALRHDIPILEIDA